MGEDIITEEKNRYGRFMIRKGSLWERIQSIIIVVLFIIILFLQNCGNKKEDINEIKKPVKIITQIDTVWSTVEIEKKVYIPKWKTKVDTVKVEVPIKVDTTEILKDYYALYEFVDTLKIDTIGYIILTDTITENNIYKRGLYKNIQIPTKEIKTTEYINNREFYTGFGARSDGNTISWMGLEGAFRNKRGNLFVIGLGTDTENNLSVGGSVHWKIGKN